MRKIPQRSLECLRSNPLGNFLWMSSRKNITLLETMTTNTRDGPHYVKRGERQCQSSQIPSNRENISLRSLRLSPMSKIGGRLTVSKTPSRRFEYLGPSPLGTLLWIPLRKNITLLETMTTSTSYGIHCIIGGTKQCWSSQIYYMPCAPSWVSNTLSDI